MSGSTRHARDRERQSRRADPDRSTALPVEKTDARRVAIRPEVALVHILSALLRLGPLSLSGLSTYRNMSEHSEISHPLASSISTLDIGAGAVLGFCRSGFLKANLNADSDGPDRRSQKAND